MTLSRASIEVLSDLIENRLAIMSIGDQDDLREKITLKRALTELRGDEVPAGILQNFADIPRRGRRRKVGAAAS
ncbi:MAG: hypothetical protein KGI97_00320 [Alphaproteobacteria bacterium]|nr:hypothetical protein [Alphaproteobacteria bacterium]